MSAKFEVDSLRELFPALSLQGRDGKNLIYMDWAATAQKPMQVIDAEAKYYIEKNGSVNRGTHLLADRATVAFEDSRSKVASFINAKYDEIVWTLNATDAFNMVANAFATASFDTRFDSIFSLNQGDEIVLTIAEHHANIVPWQEVARRTGAKLKYLSVDSNGRVDTSGLDIITDRTKVVSFTHASNVTGAVTDVAPIVEAANKVGALTVLDICQSAPHISIDVKDLGVDFACFSAHKMMGPTGVGALYARDGLLDNMPVYRTGGSMIETVQLHESTFKHGYARQEAGTLMNAQIYAWSVAIDFLNSVGMSYIQDRELYLTQYLYQQLASIDGLKVLGSFDPEGKLPLLSFAIQGVHPHDIGQFLDSYSIATRGGHHCAQPIHKHYGVHNSSRVSLSFVNTKDEIDVLVDALKKIRPYFLGEAK